MAEVGQACGKCSRCGKILRRSRPADVAVCDCWLYCPFDHGSGPFGTLMDAFTPDLSPGSYEKGDMHAVRVCNLHSPPLKSKQTPVEVRLS